ncbi:MAG TPA: glycosyltransferase family 39 protein [Myxococcota bacterium]|nr:glycosyltransferase family 39 protein [Myxococcota bacterium]
MKPRIGRRRIEWRIAHAPGRVERPGATVKRVHAARAAPRREALGVAALAVVPLLFFLDKAFSLDSPVFVAVARQIAAAPLDPFGFEMFWDETSLAVSEFNRNPPLLSYWLAPWLALFGEREWVLHAAVLPFPLVAALSFLGIARRLCGAGVAPVALLVTGPSFLVLGTTLLLDVPLLAAILLAVYCLLRGAESGGAGWQWASGAAVAAAGLLKYAGLASAPLLAAGALLLCPGRAAALARVVVPPLFVWAAWAVWTQDLYGSVHFLGSAAVVTERSFSFRLFGNQAVATFVWYGAALGFPVAVWGRALLRTGRGLELALAVMALGMLVVPFVLATGEPERRYPLELGQAALAVVAFAGAAFLWAQLLLHSRVSAGGVDAFLCLWLLGFLVFSLFVNWHVNAADALLAAPPALLLLFRRSELRPTRRLSAACAGVLLALSVALAGADAVHANFYRDVARAIAAEIGERPGARWFVGNWGFQHYLDREGFRPVLPLEFAPLELSPGDWLAVPRNVAQLDVGEHQRRAEVVEVRSWERTSWLPLRTTHLDAASGFYSHRFGYTPYAWSCEPVERVQLGRVTRVRSP